MKIFRSRVIAACLRACLFLVCADAARAQPAVSTLSGRVLDQNGEGASNATVTAHNTATSAEWSATSGPDGRYVLQFLPPGTYDLDVTLAGFSTWRAPALELGVGQDVHLDPRLRVNGVGETVMVEARARPVTSAIDGVLTAGQIEAARVPFNLRCG